MRTQIKEQQRREAEARTERLQRYGPLPEPWLAEQDIRVSKAIEDGRCLSELDWERVLLGAKS